MGGKRLAINMIANIVAFVVQFGINFLLTPYIVHTLGSEAYGFVQLSNNIISWVGILTVALNSMSGRFICIEINRQNTKKAKEYFIETRCIDEYYVRLATEEKISIETEWFAGNGKEVK